MSKTAIVIGAGLGGMASAIRLARDGWKVKVLEKNSRVGGKLDCYSDQEFLWDVGPSVINMPFVLRELFEYAGHEIEDYIELVPVDPMGRYFFPDKKTINFWSDSHLLQIEIARREKDQGESLEAFMRYAQGVYDFAAGDRLFTPPRSLMGLFAPRFLKHIHHLPKFLNGKSLAKIVDRYFNDPHIRQIFLRYASYIGCSPYRIPSLYAMIPYVELQGGSWYIQGGIYRLAEALQKCAQDLGVEFLFDAEVTEISMLENGGMKKPQTSGVVIRGGVRLDADAVICNADVTHAWARLIHINKQKAISKSLERRPFSSSSFVILCGVKKRFEQLAHHNVFFSSDYLAEADDIYQKKRIPDEPTIYVGISSRTDPTQAPTGQDNYHINVTVPSLEPDHHWEINRDKFRDKVFDRLEFMGLSNLRKHIVCEKVITPSDFSVRTHAYRGAIFGHSVHTISSLFRRPHVRSREVDRLYFVGGSTQPGGGVPMVFLSAQRAVREVISESD
jgi:phytoene desaturase